MLRAQKRTHKEIPPPPSILARSGSCKRVGRRGAIASLRGSYSGSFTMDSVAIPTFLDMKTKE